MGDNNQQLKRVFRWTMLLLCWVLLSRFGLAAGITVDEANIGSLTWGDQQLEITLTNGTDDLKFVTVETNLEITGATMATERTATSHHVILPTESQTVQHVLFVPGSFGKMSVSLALYDVVDTLDTILPGQKFYDETYDITLQVPQAVTPYLEKRIDLPPMVNRHPYFDSELSRIMLILLDEGKTVSQIADMMEADTAFVAQHAVMLAGRKMVRRVEDRFELTFPVIKETEGRAAVNLADEIASSLASVIGENMEAYWKTVDSLVGAGLVDADSNDFRDPGGVAYRPYPVVSGLLIWFQLGRQFITDSLPLTIYAGSDLCNANIPEYMYAVRAGEEYQGEHFYFFETRGPSYQILFSDNIPEINCGEDFEQRARLNRRVSWGYAEPYVPESFMIDTAAVMPLLQALQKGTAGPMAAARKRLASLAERYERGSDSKAYRYWFWNLVATRTLRDLVDRGVVTRRGNGFYKLDGIWNRK